MELLQFNIAAGETKRFEMRGRYLEIIDASGQLSVEFTGPNGEQSNDMRNALAGFYSEEPFAGFEVFSATAQNVVLMLTDGRGGSRRLAVTGSVNVADADIARTLGNQVGLACYKVQAAVNQPAFQLWNPAASGQVIYVEGLEYQCSAAGSPLINIHTSALATALGTAPVAALRAAENLSAFGFDTRQQTSGAVPGTFMAQLASVAANVLYTRRFKRPWRIQPGQGFIISGPSAAATMEGTIDFAFQPA
jgi:hypothetical protein